MGKAVFCTVSTQLKAEAIVAELKVAGFSSDDVSVLFPDQRGTKDFAHEQHTKAPEGAVAGASTGGVAGGTFGLLAGIGALAIPGLGPFIAAGPIMALLSGAAVGAAVGGVAGALVGLGIPEYEAKRYEGKLKGGNILLSIDCASSDEVRRAEEIMRRAGADDIATATEAKVKDARPTASMSAR